MRRPECRVPVGVWVGSLWQQAGISSVPSVIVNQRHLIQGGQPPEVFEKALRQIAAEA